MSVTNIAQIIKNVCKEYQMGEAQIQNIKNFTQNIKNSVALCTTGPFGSGISIKT